MKIYFNNIYQFDFQVDYIDPPSYWHPLLFEDPRIKQFIQDNLANNKTTQYEFIYDESSPTSEVDSLMMRSE